MELKKPHPSRLIKGAEMQRHRTGWFHTHMGWIKIWEGYFGSEGSQPHTRTLAHSPSDRKISLINCGCKNQWQLSQWKKFLEFQAVPLKESAQRLIQVTPSELQHQSSSLESISGIRGGTEVSGIKARADGQLSPRQKGRQKPMFHF